MAAGSNTHPTGIPTDGIEKRRDLVRILTLLVSVRFEPRGEISQTSRFVTNSLLGCHTNVTSLITVI